MVEDDLIERRKEVSHDYRAKVVDKWENTRDMRDILYDKDDLLKLLQD